ncbi:FkbM family methyltransferase [Methylomagnum sp.]
MSDEIFEANGVKIDFNNPFIHEEMKEALRRGGYESFETRLVKRLLKPGHKVLEIGACTGYITMLAAKQVGAENVCTFEANPAAVEAALNHFSLNNLPIQIFNRVLMSRVKFTQAPETVELFLYKSPVSSSLFSFKANARSVSVPVGCLEDEIAKHGANFLIIDIEGGEADLLEDADLSSIDGIIMETHYRKAGEWRINEMVKALFEKGFYIDLRNTHTEVLHLYKRPLSEG